MQSPGCDFLLGVVKRKKPVLIEALGTQPAVEGFDDPIVRRLSGTTEVQTHALQVRPLVQPLARKLAAVIHADLRWERSPIGRDPVEHAGDIIATQAAGHLDRQAFACEVIDYRQEPEATPIEELVGHEIHAPALVGVSRPGQLWPGGAAPVPTRLVPAYAESFFPVEPVDPLAIHHPALPAQPDPDPLITQRDMHACKFLDPRSEHGLIVLHALVALRGTGMVEALRTHDARSRRTPTVISSPSPASDQALQLSFEGILQDVLVQTVVRHELFELPILLLELLQTADLGHAHPGELFLPPIERLLAHAHLPAHIPHCSAALGLMQRERDLLLRKPRLLHGYDLQTEAGFLLDHSTYEWTKKRV